MGGLQESREASEDGIGEELPLPPGNWTLGDFQPAHLLMGVVDIYLASGFLGFGGVMSLLQVSLLSDVAVTGKTRGQHPILRLKRPNGQ